MRALFWSIVLVCVSCRPPDKPQDPVVLNPLDVCDRVILALEQIDESLWESYYRNGCAYPKEDQQRDY